MSPSSLHLLEGNGSTYCSIVRVGEGSMDDSEGGGGEHGHERKKNFIFAERERAFLGFLGYLGFRRAAFSSLCIHSCDINSDP